MVVSCSFENAHAQNASVFSLIRKARLSSLSSRLNLWMGRRSGKVVVAVMSGWFGVCIRRVYFRPLTGLNTNCHSPYATLLNTPTSRSYSNKVAMAWGTSSYAVLPSSLVYVSDSFCTESSVSKQFTTILGSRRFGVAISSTQATSKATNISNAGNILRQFFLISMNIRVRISKQQPWF